MWRAQAGVVTFPVRTSSALLTEDAGVPFHELQAEQIRRFIAELAWAARLA